VIPSLWRVTYPVVSEPSVELVDSCQSHGSLVTSYANLEPGPLGSTGITRRCHYYGPIRHHLQPSRLLTEFSLWFASTLQGLPVLLIDSSCMHAIVITPAELVKTHRSKLVFNSGGLRCIPGTSASTLPFSRPARRSLTLRPACSLTPQRRPFLEVLQRNSLPPSTAPSATGRSN
jgi:hypothetical protein